MRRLFNVGMGAFAPIPLSDPLTALGVATGVASGLGNMIGSFGSNFTNKKIAREQMAWQTAEREKSQQWQEMMWNKTNEYNTPSAMRSRLQEAGYNPWLSGSEQVGQGASTPSVPAMPSSPNFPSQIPVRYGDALSGIIEPLIQLKGLKIQESSVNNKNAMDFVSNIPEMRQHMSWSQINEAGKKLANFGGNFGESDMLDNFLSSYLKSAKMDSHQKEFDALIAQTQHGLLTHYGDAKEQAMINHLVNQANLLAEQRRLVLTEQDIKKIERGLLPQSLAAHITSLLADAGLKYASASQIRKMTPLLAGVTAMQFLGSLRSYNSTEATNQFWQSDLGSIVQMITPLFDKYLELLSVGSKVANTAK